jgi:flagellar biosynthesis/type III secretory pathway protein FliH
VTADPRVPRGGCKVESEYGDIDAGVDAQIQEIARALLGDTKKA